MRQNKLSDAERLLRHSLEIMKSAHTEDHPYFAGGMCSFSDTIVRRLTLLTKTTLLTSRCFNVLSIISSLFVFFSSVHTFSVCVPTR